MSKDNPKAEPYYQRQAKDFIDMIFDNKLFNPNLSRTDIQEVENYVGYLLESAAKTSAKVAVMLEKIKK